MLELKYNIGVTVVDPVDVSFIIRVYISRKVLAHLGVDFSYVRRMNSSLPTATTDVCSSAPTRRHPPQVPPWRPSVYYTVASRTGNKMLALQSGSAVTISSVETVTSTFGGLTISTSQNKSNLHGYTESHS